MKVKGFVFGIVISWAVAFFVFWLIFFGLAPAITSVIPQSDWKGFLDIVVYVIIGWFGGIGIPLTIGIVGTATVLQVSK